jgi:Ca2+-binding RTX toxin-like protein
MARAEALTRSLLDVADDLSDLVHRQFGLLCDDHDYYDERTVVDNVFTVGADTLDGGEGNDVLIGDDNHLAETSFTLPVGLAGDFERFAEGVTLAAHELTHVMQDVGDLDRHLREVTVLVSHFHEELERHVDLVLMGNDTILGGSGNDLIVGDAFIVRSAEVTLVPGGSPWDAGGSDDWLDDDWKDKYGFDGWGWGQYQHHDDHDDHDWALSGIKVGADVIWGGSGKDLIWGDNLALITSTVTRGAGLSWSYFDKARDEAEDGLEACVELTDSATYWLAQQGGGHHHHDDGQWHHDEPAEFDNGDVISGGDGDDIVFGQGGDDTLRGDAGNDWLVGGDGSDKLDGGPGWDKTTSGNESSSALRSSVAARMIDWDDSFRGYGLAYAPFGGFALASGGQPNLASFEFLFYDRPGHRDD